MIQFQIFPGGKRRAVTFSYDDGHPNDARLLPENRVIMKNSPEQRGADCHDTSLHETVSRRKGCKI